MPYSAQDLLDQLHAIDLPRLTVSTLSAKEREAAIQLAAEKLTLVRKRLQQQIRDVEARWDGRDRQQAIAQQLELAPYRLLADVIDQLDIGLSELRLGQQPTHLVSLGRWIVGSGMADWQLVDDRGYFAWQHQQMLAEFKLIQRKLQQAQTRLHTDQNRIGQWRLYGLAFGGSLGCIGSALFAALRSPTAQFEASPNLSGCLCLPALLLVVAGIFGAGLAAPDYGQKRQKFRQAKDMVKKLETSVERIQRADHILKIRGYLAQVQALLDAVIANPSD